MNGRAGSPGPAFLSDLLFRPHVVLALVAGLFAVGLYPFDFFPKNRVTPLPSGYSFEGRALVLGETWFAPDGDLALEAVLTPFQEPSHHLARILALVDSAGVEYLTLSQWKAEIEVGGKRALRKAGVEAVLPRGQAAAIRLVCAGARGTLFVGEEARASFPLNDLRNAPSRLRVILGNSPDGKDPWLGRIEGVRLGDPSFPASPPAWRIPDPFRPLRPGILTIMGRDELRLSRSFLSDAIINLLGFIPLGFCLGGLLEASRRLRRMLLWPLVIGAGFATSLAIELLQVALPGRTSSLSDLALNTAGTAAGLLLLRFLSPTRRRDML